MIDSRLFNSPFEMELRMLLLLSVDSKTTYTVDRIIALDFISCYAADFSLPYGNLHGQNNYKYGEISNRRMLIQEAVKTAVTRGLINVVVDRGYLFSISEQGLKYIRKLKDAYALEYKATAKAAVKKYRKDSDEDILASIQSFSLRSLKG
ncbi:MAG: ABC-three component system middle component 2 [Suipraeoptans sp.]